MTEVEWPERRIDVINALDALATLTSEATAPWPDLTNAVHWLVDDTLWDQHPPAEDIGLLLRDHTEAHAVIAVIEPLLRILDELGPTRPDADYLNDPRWEDVRTAAVAAHRLLAGAPGNGTTRETE